MEYDIESFFCLNTLLIQTLVNINSEQEKSRTASLLQVAFSIKNMVGRLTSFLNDMETNFALSILVSGKFLSAFLKLIVNVETKAKQEVQEGIRPRDDSVENAINVWIDTTVPIKDDKGQMIAGNLNQLINYLTTTPGLKQNIELENFLILFFLDVTFLSAFITTYQSFTTPWMLMDKLMERFAGPPPNTVAVDENTLLTIRLRVCVILKHWIDKQFFDLDKSLIDTLEHFVKKELCSKEGALAEMGKRLSNSLDQFLEELNKTKFQNLSESINIMVFFFFFKLKKFSSTFWSH